MRLDGSSLKRVLAPLKFVLSAKTNRRSILPLFKIKMMPTKVTDEYPIDKIEFVAVQIRCECCERIIYYGIGHNIHEIKGKKENCSFCTRPRFTDSPLEIK